MQWQEAKSPLKPAAKANGALQSPKPSNQGTDKSSGAADENGKVAAELVGQRIKVWWPQEKQW